jgi:hypothetical protein
MRSICCDLLYSTPLGLKQNTYLTCPRITFRVIQIKAFQAFQALKLLISPDPAFNPQLISVPYLRSTLWKKFLFSILDPSIPS